MILTEPFRRTIVDLLSLLLLIFKKLHLDLSGPPNDRSSRAYTAEEENLLVSYLQFMAMAGVKLTVKRALSVASYVGKKKGTLFHTRDGNPTPGWWNRFKLKHTEVGSLVCDVKDGPQSSEERSEGRENPSLTEIESLIKEIDRNKDEDRFYNMVTVTTRVSSQGELKEFMVPTCVTETKDQIMTMSICSGASGKILPSMITVTPSLKREINPETEGSLWTETATGDVDCETFLEYLQKIDELLCNTRPVYVFTSGLQDLIGVEVVDFCLEKAIHILHIPIPNVIQPADIIPRIMLAKLKPTSMELVQKDTLKKSVTHVIKMLVATAQEVQGEPIKLAFRETGMFPFDQKCLVPGSIRKREPNNKVESYAAKRALALQKR